MQNWFMLTLVGQDKMGIVARLSQCLYDGGCNLGEASMLRLGGNFTVMLMVNTNMDETELHVLLEPLAAELEVRLHVDEIEGHLHQHQKTDVSISVHGADRSGIVAQVTQVLADSGLNIVDLSTDVVGDETNPIYVMQIEGVATQGMDALQAALDTLQESQADNLQVHLSALDKLVM